MKHNAAQERLRSDFTRCGAELTAIGREDCGLRENKVRRACRSHSLSSTKMKSIAREKVKSETLERGQRCEESLSRGRRRRQAGAELK
jgi:hypothetical protein